MPILAARRLDCLILITVCRRWEISRRRQTVFVVAVTAGVTGVLSYLPVLCSAGLTAGRCRGRGGCPLVVPACGATVWSHGWGIAGEKRVTIKISARGVLCQSHGGGVSGWAGRLAGVSACGVIAWLHGGGVVFDCRLGFGGISVRCDRLVAWRQDITPWRLGVPCISVVCALPVARW